MCNNKQKNKEHFESIYVPTNALRDTIYIIHTENATCFDIQVPSSRSYYDKVVRANMLVYVLFIVIGLSKNQLLKYINCTKYIKSISLIIYSVLTIH